MIPKQFKHIIPANSVDNFLQEVFDEVGKAEEKFPLWPKSLSIGMQIINEEMGEANKAALDCEFRRDELKNVRTELVQTAAMCIRQIAAIDCNFML